jgi:hypothetical protein
VHVASLVCQCRDGRLNDPEFGSRMRGAGPYAELIRQLSRPPAAATASTAASCRSEPTCSGRQERTGRWSCSAGSYCTNSAGCVAPNVGSIEKGPTRLVGIQGVTVPIGAQTPYRFTASISELP